MRKLQLSPRIIHIAWGQVVVKNQERNIPADILETKKAIKLYNRLR